MKRTYSLGDGLKAEIMAAIKRRVQPGESVTKKDWQVAYAIVRANAIADTLLWKKQHITIANT